MIERRVVTDPYRCEKLWKSLIPARSVSDLWEFRMCFHPFYKNRFCFHVLEEKGNIYGVLPLSHIEYLDMMAFFPGETWKDKTWIERTPVYAINHDILYRLISDCAERTYLRYMEYDAEYLHEQMTADETGYVVYPEMLSFDKENYRSRFSNKKFKSIIRDVNNILDMGASFHVNRIEDFELLVEMSIERYGADSYLQDTRFRKSFREIIRFLNQKGYLRMVSLELEGRTMAVDVGALYNGVYTIFLGGVFSRVPGLAKAMNMHHIDYALKNRFYKVDFLCGDFNWKKLWHLDEEPLFKFVSPDLEDTTPMYDISLPDNAAKGMEVY
ncbi:MAG: GNAT family N-acetyltransferase [Deltaproteobacteria bacterium]|nr:GNAT family N-acetyltransferase [Deltaproteobacteria bacterium]